MVNKKVKLLKALADETRFKIILFLVNGPKQVSAITKHVNKAQPTVSLQLKLLELNGIIESTQDGRKRFYKIVNKKALEIVTKW